jgi:hypothetical protein
MRRPPRPRPRSRTTPRSPTTGRHRGRRRWPRPPRRSRSRHTTTPHGATRATPAAATTPGPAAPARRARAATAPAPAGVPAQMWSQWSCPWCQARETGRAAHRPAERFPATPKGWPAGRASPERVIRRQPGGRRHRPGGSPGESRARTAPRKDNLYRTLRQRSAWSRQGRPGGGFRQRPAWSRAGHPGGGPRQRSAWSRAGQPGGGLRRCSAWSRGGEPGHALRPTPTRPQNLLGSLGTSAGESGRQSGM